MKGVFLHRTIRWNESGFSYRPDPKHVDALIATLSREHARPVAKPFTRDTRKGQANTSSELSVTEQAIYMSGSGLLHHIALDRMDVVFATKEVRSRTAKADVLALLLLKRVARYLVGHGEKTKSCPYQSNPSQINRRRDNAIVNDSWSIHTRGSLASGMVSNTESQGLVVRSVGVLCTRIWSSKRLVDETHLSRSWRANENTCASVASRGMAQRLGAGKCRHIEVKWLWLQQALDEKKLATKHVSTASNVADIGTKGLASDRTRKLMNQMGMSLVAGVECLLQQTMEKTTWTSIPDRGMSLSTRY